jgi:uncharacterized membrane protein
MFLDGDDAGSDPGSNTRDQLRALNVSILTLVLMVQKVVMSCRAFGRRGFVCFLSFSNGFG